MAKIFIGLALVITLVTAALGFLTKSNIQGIRDKATEAVNAKNKAEGNLQVAKTELKKAQDDVAAAKTAVDEKDKEVAAKTAQIDALTKQTADAKTASEDKDKQIEDLKGKLAGTKPVEAPVGPDPAVLDELKNRAAKAEAEMAEAKQLVETMNRKIKDNDSKVASLEQYKRDRERQLQRPGVSGRILAVNPGWNFVVLSIGDRQGLMTNSPLLVMRDGEPIAKVRVTSIETSRSIADVIPGSVRRGVTVQPGDNVVYEGSRNKPIHVAEPAATAPATAPASSALPSVTQ
jgi:hypothetical protein